jgi:hypothetical protein
MMYMRFSPISRNEWAVTVPVKSTKPIATVTRHNHRCSVTINGALNREELDSLSAFMQEQES